MKSIKINRHPILFLFLIINLGLLILLTPSPALAAGDSPCKGNPVDFGFTKKFLPMYPASGRKPTCIKPKYIIIHTTSGEKDTPESVHSYFASGAEGKRTGSQFLVGQDGKGFQLGEMTDQGVDLIQHARYYNQYSIGIEIAGKYIRNNKTDGTKPEQYAAVIKLVQALMKQYNIKPQDVQHGPDWKSKSDTYSNPPSGIYAHYQINPGNKEDPGPGFQKDLMKDIGSGGSGAPAGGGGSGTATSCVITKVGEPTGPAPALPAECTSGGGSSIVGLETPPNLKEHPQHKGYFLMPKDTRLYDLRNCYPNHYYGSKLLISVLYTVAKQWKQKYPQGIIRYGDFNASGHKSHKWGRAVDVDGTTNGKDCIANYDGTRGCSRGNYNEEATVEFGKMLIDTDKALSIWYNDTSINSKVLAHSKSSGKSKGLVMMPQPGHANHYHFNVDLEPRLAVWEPGC